MLTQRELSIKEMRLMYVRKLSDDVLEVRQACTEGFVEKRKVEICFQSRIICLKYAYF